MNLIEFILVIAALAGALALGLSTSLRQRKRIREEVLADPGRYAGAIAVVRQNRMLQAEHLLMNQGKTRQAARMTAVIIKGLLRSGQLK